jgi:adenylate kinase
LESGGLVPDELTNAIVRERIAADDVRTQGFVLDGFPRTPNQAQALLDMLGDNGLHTVLELSVPIEEVTARMKARAREDDTDESIAKRLSLYDAETVPTIDWFRERGMVVEVDGLGTEDDVAARVADAIDKALADNGDALADSGDAMAHGDAMAEPSDGMATGEVVTAENGAD